MCAVSEFGVPDGAQKGNYANMHLTLLATAPSSAGAGAAGTAFLVIIFAFAIASIVCFWRIFTKAGKPGWAILVPIYNLVALINVSGHSGWWLLILLIPGVDIIFIIVFSMVVYWDLGKAFGKGVLFRLGLMFLGPIFIPILAFGKAQYVGARPTPLAVTIYR